MSTKTKEKIFSGIIIVCVLLCVLLIGRVVYGNMTKGANTPVHQPVLPHNTGAQDAAKTYSMMVVEEDDIEDGLKKYFPEGFPIKEVDVEIEPDGTLRFESEVSKKAVTKYLAGFGIELGIKESLLAGLLPKKLDLVAKFTCSCDDDSGTLMVTPSYFKIGDYSMSTDMIPLELTQVFSSGLNKYLIDTGYFFSRIDFGDGVIKLVQ